MINNKEKLVFIIDSHPMGQQRAKYTVRGKYGHAYTPEKSRNYKAFCEEIITREMKKQNWVCAIGAVCVEMVVYLPIPKSWSKKKHAEARAGLILPTVKPDNDNAEKIVWDSMSGLAYCDDKQITDNHTIKRYSDTYEDGAVIVAVTKLQGE